MAADKCDHQWYWRRHRNKSWGYWECIACGLKSDHIGLDVHGGPAEGPPDSDAKSEKP